MIKSKLFVAAALGIAGVLAAGAAQARTDVQWSVTVGTPVGVPVYTQPVPVYPVPVYQPAPVYQPVPVYRSVPVYTTPVYGHHPYRGGHYGGQYGGQYGQPTRWDADGDRIPNHRDRVYNPRWDVDGDGIPNRQDHRPWGR